MRGLLNIDKPSGITSYDVIRSLKAVTHSSHLGHAGTLDPLASGVLLILFNEATKIARFLIEMSKEYVATVRLGVETDTFDCSGNVKRELPVPDFEEREIEEVLSRFRGEIAQTPPVFSSLKQNGERMYNLARRGVPVKPKPRLVSVYKLEFLHYSPPFLKFRGVVSKGTYVRSLAHDIGTALRCCASLYELRRTRVGPFGIEKSVSPEYVTSANLCSLLVPVEEALSWFRTAVLERDALSALLLGRTVPRPGNESSSHYVKAVDRERKVLVIARASAACLCPIRVIYNDGYL